MLDISKMSPSSEVILNHQNRNEKPITDFNISVTQSLGYFLFAIVFSPGTWAYLGFRDFQGFGGLTGISLFLHIFISRYQYFNLRFSSLIQFGKR